MDNGPKTQTRDDHMVWLQEALARVKGIREETHPPRAPGMILQCIHAEVNIVEAIEKLRSAHEKSTPAGILISDEQVARILTAIRET